MKISDEKTLAELQKDFQSVFPYLKIEFFMMPHDKGETSDEQDLLNTALTVGAVRQSHNIGFLTLDGNLTAGEFERKMKEIFALNVQVYRKEYKRWRQTWVSDDWTLQEQNRRSSIMGEKGTTIAEIRGKVMPFLASFF